MILVTGGAGYIGSHTCVELLAAGHDLIVLDNLSNASVESLRRVSLIARVDYYDLHPSNDHRLVFIEGDIQDRALLRSIFERFKIEAVLHFAGLKAVGESVAMPLRYYNNNVSGSMALFEVMIEFGCKCVVFSSSATVYGNPASVPIREDFSLSATNPYGRSKLIVEGILRDLSCSDDEWRIALLRYFNPVGAHESGLIGEDPRGIPNNLMPYLSQVAINLRNSINIFGSDYPTADGTGVRDYIHVVDLAKGHLKALDALAFNKGVLTVNLGAGRGYSVLEVVAAFERASGRKIPYTFADRRVGDVAQCYADTAYAKEVLGWQAEFDLDRMCEDAWRWQYQNPSGYKGGN